MAWVSVKQHEPGEGGHCTVVMYATISAYRNSGLQYIILRPIGVIDTTEVSSKYTGSVYESIDAISFIPSLLLFFATLCCQNLLNGSISQSLVGTFHMLSTAQHPTPHTITPYYTAPNGSSVPVSLLLRLHKKSSLA